MPETAQSPDADPFEVRPFRAGDETALTTLFSRTFGSSIDVAHWRWKLNHAATPGPSVPNVLLAQADGRPVLQYAGIPTPMLLQGQAANAMVSVDTMTDPDFRRRGLLTRVASESYARWRDAGIDMVLGLPNEQWGKRTVALGWQPLFPLQWLRRPLRPEALLARRLSMPWLNRMTMASGLWNGLLGVGLRRDPAILTQKVAQADAAFDDLWQRCREDAAFAVVRDRRWVQWRFLDCPSRRYEVRLARRGRDPVAYSAHRIESAPGRCAVVLAELFAPRADREARDSLWADLLAEWQALGADLVSTLAVPGSAHHRWLRRQGFLPGPSFSVEVVPLSSRLPLEAMRRPEQWDLSGAAFDVI